MKDFTFNLGETFNYAPLLKNLYKSTKMYEMKKIPFSSYLLLNMKRSKVKELFYEAIRGEAESPSSLFEVAKKLLFMDFGLYYSLSFI